mmetsp:Transcript_2625/g.3631  ORF Transcript_2625/g.3631 Transcript_2625/m.3631 type:complete len:81 (-) Transcript_2625:185-427(-)
MALLSLKKVGARGGSQPQGPFQQLGVDPRLFQVTTVFKLFSKSIKERKIELCVGDGILALLLIYPAAVQSARTIIWEREL